MASRRLVACGGVAAVLATSHGAAAQDGTIVLKASTVLDGKGGVVRDTAIVIEGSN